MTERPVAVEIRTKDGVPVSVCFPTWDGMSREEYLLELKKALDEVFARGLSYELAVHSRVPQERGMRRTLFILNYRGGSLLWQFLAGHPIPDVLNPSTGGKVDVCNPLTSKKMPPGFSHRSFWLSTTESMSVPCEELYLVLDDLNRLSLPWTNFSWYAHIGDWWGQCSGQEVSDPYDYATPTRLGPSELSSFEEETGHPWTVVALVRDGRNQIESLRRIKGGVEEEHIRRHGPEDYFIYLCKAWRNKMRMIIDGRSQRPDKYHIFHFEDLVRAPVPVVASMLRKGGFDPCLSTLSATFDFLVSQGLAKVHSSFDSAGSPEVHNSRHESWTDQEREIFHSICDREMRELGYL